MKKKKKRILEIRVGTVILIALAIMISVVFFIGGHRKLFGDKIKYQIQFNATGGLYVGDPVLLTGVEIGNVTRIGFPKEIEQKKILVEISVLKEISARIRTDTRARIKAASLVYGKVIELTMGSPNEPPIPEDGYIEADDITGYGAIVDSTNLMVEDIRNVLSKVNTGGGMVSTLLNESLGLRQTLHQLSISSEKLAVLMDRLEKGQGTLGALLSDSVEFQQTITDLSDLVKNLRGTETFAGKLINDKTYGKTVSNDFRSAMHSIASIAAKIDTGHGSIGRLINEEELYQGIEDVVLGVKKSSIAKALIRGRRKSGEKERVKQTEKNESK
jgi:phospholipid/cholesterol/gamma-HCH transport system substrate-binding protein